MVESAILPGKSYDVFPVDGDMQAPKVRCIDFDQRNWSRVGTGELLFPDGTSQACFIKQYLDKAGAFHSDHWEYEKDGAMVASEILAAVATVPRLLAQNEKLYLNIFEFTEIVSLDVLLRSDEVAFDRCIVGVISQMARVLEAMQQPPAEFDMTALPQKTRNYGSSTAVNFKGFEIRNAGVAADVGAEPGPGGLVLFDFVRPYAAPVEEAAAKLFVSIGMLNWGSPLGRCLKGPDKRLLAKAREILAPWLDKRAVEAELDLQQRFRTGEFKGSGGLEVALKRFGVELIGRRYLRKLRSWCEAHVS